MLKSNKFLNKLKQPKKPNMLWFFSDEHIFSQHYAQNRQNNRWITMCAKDMPRVMKTKFPTMIMIFSVISSDGNVMPPHIFETGLWVNTEIYRQVMEIWCWIMQVAGSRPWVWQQDNAPCHVSKHSLT